MKRSRTLVAVFTLCVLWLTGCDRPEVADREPTESTPSVAENSGSQRAAGLAVLSGAARWLGTDTSPTIETIRALADVTVRPDTDRFETLILSSRDGRARMHQSTGLHAGLHPDGSWMVVPGEDRTAELPAGTRPVVRGHELHAMVLMPLTRLSEPRFRGETDFAETTALEVEVLNEWGDTLRMFFAREDTVPLGMRLAGVVEVRLSDWELRDGLRLFRSATFDDTDNVYHYRYRILELNDVADQEFLVR